MNQIVFFANDRTNCYNARVANVALQDDNRRDINFEISQNEKNNIDSSFDSLQIRISIKRVLQNIIVTINNQFLKKKKKCFKDTKRKSRFDLLSRVDFNFFSYVFRPFAFVILFSRNIKRVSERIVEQNIARATRAKQTAKKQKIENDDDVVDVDNYFKRNFAKFE